MKANTTNFYRFLSLALVAAGAFAYVNADTGKTQATLSSEPEPKASTSTAYSRNRHTITLALNELSDLKVEEGQRVNVGDVISDRTTERTKLQAKKQRLETAIAKAKLPLKELKPVPIPKFQTELVALKQAQFKLDSIVQQIEDSDKKFYYQERWREVFESEKIQKLAELKRQELAASLDVERAIAALDEAKLNYQRQQYEHSLKVANYQTALQKQQEQVNSLQLQLDKVNDELETLVSVYSPYRGKVRRVKILGQSERDINIGVTLDIRGGW